MEAPQESVPMSRPTKADNKPVPAVPPAPPSNEAIARRAYELYLERGSVSGYELEDWLLAEAELTAAAAAATAKR
jgi:Protein of unknown function (DUF2934)